MGVPPPEGRQEEGVPRAQLGHAPLAIEQRQAAVVLDTFVVVLDAAVSATLQVAVAVAAALQVDTRAVGARVVGGEGCDALCVGREDEDRLRALVLQQQAVVAHAVARAQRSRRGDVQPRALPRAEAAHEIAHGRSVEGVLHVEEQLLGRLAVAHHLARAAHHLQTQGCQLMLQAVAAGRRLRRNRLASSLPTAAATAASGVAGVAAALGLHVDPLQEVLPADVLAPVARSGGSLRAGVARRALTCEAPKAGLRRWLAGRVKYMHGLAAEVEADLLEAAQLMMQAWRERGGALAEDHRQPASQRHACRPPPLRSAHVDRPHAPALQRRPPAPLHKRCLRSRRSRRRLRSRRRRCGRLRSQRRRALGVHRTQVVHPIRCLEGLEASGAVAVLALVHAIFLTPRALAAANDSTGSAVQQRGIESDVATIDHRTTASAAGAAALGLGQQLSKERRR